MKRLIFAVLAVLLVMGLAASSDAVTKRKGMGMHGGMAGQEGGCGCDGHMEKLAALGLDEKQTEAIKAIHLTAKKDMVKRKADIQVAEIELQELLAKDPVDLKAAEAAVKKIEGLKSDMKMMHIRTREEVKSKLTPDQKKKFITSICTGPMGCGMGMMMGRHGGCDTDSMEHKGHMGEGQGKDAPMQHRHH